MNTRKINLDQHGIPTNSKGYADVVAKYEQIKSQEQRSEEYKRKQFASCRKTEPHRYGAMEMWKAAQDQDLKIKVHPPRLSTGVNILDD
jgi:hypothetical protein